MYSLKSEWRWKLKEYLQSALSTVAMSTVQQNRIFKKSPAQRTLQLFIHDWLDYIHPILILKRQILSWSYNDAKIIAINCRN